MSATLLTNAAALCWWERLPYNEAQGVMRRQATTAEVRRLHSDRAARTWWNLLPTARRVAVYEAEQQEVLHAPR